MSNREDTNGLRSVSTDPRTHMIVLPGGGYAEHAAHEAERQAASGEEAQ